MLISDEYQNDPRIKEAFQLILDALNENQKKITGIKPPNPDLKISYASLIEEISLVRGGKLYYPYLGSGFGKGPLVELLDGSIKYDFISGIGVHFYGHNHPDILKASLDASLSDTIMQGHLQQNIDTLEISEILLKESGFDHCFLTSSGVMANENALKMTFQKQHPKNRVIAFEGCFAGRTLAVSQITDKPQYRSGLPQTLTVDYVPFYDSNNPEESVKITLDALKKITKRYPDQHAVMMLELVQGEGGFYSGSSSFFLEICRFLKEHQIAIIVDEVQTFGRTPSLFAFQYFDLASFVDIVTIGKLSQVCATLFTNDYVPKPGLISQTFTSSTSAIKAGKYLIETLSRGNYYGPNGKISRLHNCFVDHCVRLNKKYPGDFIGPYGLGAMTAFTIFNGDFNKTASFAHKLFELGVITFIAGQKHARVRMLMPALAVEESDIAEAFTIIEEAYLCFI